MSGMKSRWEIEFMITQQLIEWLESANAHARVHYIPLTNSTGIRMALAETRPSGMDQADVELAYWVLANAKHKVNEWKRFVGVKVVL